MRDQAWRIAPNTSLGKWSVVLIIAMPILFVIGTSLTSTLYESIPAGENILSDIAVRPALALTMLAGMAAGISAFITGSLSIIREKGKVFLVCISTAIGALLILFLAGEIFVPH